MDTIFSDPVERKYWSKIWQNLIVQGKPDTWDYQWTFSCLINGGLTALPNRNLVRNIGFGEDATHTTGKSNAPRVDAGIDPSVIPAFVLRDAKADLYTFRHSFGGYQVTAIIKWLVYPANLIKSFFNHKHTKQTV